MNSNDFEIQKGVLIKYRGKGGDVTIPDGVTSIGNYAFSGCGSLTSVAIPDSMTSIGDGVFYFCSSLTSVTIPDGVTSIGRQAFCGCSRLASVQFNGTKEAWQAIEKGDNWKYKVPAKTIVCTDGRLRRL
jgi:hypothetical protein